MTFEYVKLGTGPFLLVGDDILVAPSALGQLMRECVAFA